MNGNKYFILTILFLLLVSCSTANLPISNSEIDLNSNVSEEIQTDLESMNIDNEDSHSVESSFENKYLELIAEYNQYYSDSYYINNVELVEGNYYDSSLVKSINKRIMFNSTSDEVFLEFLYPCNISNLEETSLYEINNGCFLKYNEEANSYQNIIFSIDGLDYVTHFYLELSKPKIEDNELVIYATHYNSQSFYSLFEPHYSVYELAWVLLREQIISKYRIVISSSKVDSNHLLDRTYLVSDAIELFEVDKQVFAITENEIPEIDFIIDSIYEIDSIEVKMNEKIVFKAKDAELVFYKENTYENSAGYYFKCRDYYCSINVNKGILNISIYKTVFLNNSTNDYVNIFTRFVFDFS